MGNYKNVYIDGLKVSKPYFYVQNGLLHVRGNIMNDKIKDRISTILALFSNCSDFDKDLVLFFLWNSEHCSYKTTYHSNEIMEKITQVEKHKSSLVYWRGKSRVYCYNTEFFTFYFNFSGNRLKSKFIFA